MIKTYTQHPKKQVLILWNVTITGESAGAHNVMNMVISPLAKGLFHRAMSQSGGMTTTTVDAGKLAAENIIDMILASQGVDRAVWDAWTPETQETFLKGLSAEQIWGPLIDFSAFPTFDAYQDGHVIPGSVVSTIRSGNYNKVPIILGANKSETKAFMPLYGPLIGMDNWYGLPDVLEGNIASIDYILPTAFDKYLYNTAGYYGSRNWRAKFVDERARALKEQQNRVYAYQFDWGEPGSGPTPFDLIYGAAHTMEIPFFFGQDTSTWGYGYNPSNDTAGRKELSDAMMKYLSSFARTGNPNFCRLPRWKKWSNDADGSKAIIFDATMDEAVLQMSTEEVDILTEMGKLEAEISTWPTEAQALGFVPMFFQWQVPE